MSETLYFNQNGTNWKATWEDYNYPENPREYYDNLGTMVFFKHKNYRLGDEQVSDFQEYFKNELEKTGKYDEEIKEIFALNNKPESALFELWKDTKAVVVPINIYEHSGITCHASSVRKTLRAANDRDDGFIYNDGFIFVDKDNKEFQNELLGEARDKDGKVYNKWTPKTEEEAKEWAKGVLNAEIKDYASYLEGDVHTLTTYAFNEKTLEWEMNDLESNIIGSSLEENLNQHDFDTSKKLTSKEVFTLENTINPVFKEAVIKVYFDSVKENLKDFDGNIKAAATSVMKEWKAKEDVNREESDRVNRWTLKKEALNEYLSKDNLLYSPEKMFDFIAEKCSVKSEKQELKPLDVRQEGLECYYSKNKSPDSSAKGSVHSILLIDHETKRFAYAKGVEYMIDTPSETYLGRGNVHLLSSSKKVENECIKVIKAGYKNSPVDRIEDYRYKNDRIEKHILKEGREGY